MSIEEITKREFENYLRKGSIFDQISWRLRPEHIQENGLMTIEDLKFLCWHFYVWGVSDFMKIQEAHERQKEMSG